MKYRDLITVFLVIVIILLFAFVIGVEPSLWYIPALVFLVTLFIFYKLWIEKD